MFVFFFKSPQVLIDWINDVLVGERIIVKDLAEDLYDGQVLQKLFGKKHGMSRFEVVCRPGVPPPVVTGRLHCTSTSVSRSQRSWRARS